MKKLSFYMSLLFISVMVQSCAIAGGIFKAGVWVGILAVVAFIGLIIFLVTRGGKN
jgi:hypothetical protein